MSKESFEADHSRGLRLAQGVSSSAGSMLERRLEESCVVLSVDTSVPQAMLTARVLLTTLRRGPGRLALRDDTLSAQEMAQLERAVWEIDPQRPLQIERHPKGEATVRLHIGTNSSEPAIRLCPEGYGAHVAGMRSARIDPRQEASPLGAIFTAALGAAEAFKYCAAVLPHRRVLHRHLRFCPVSLSADLAAAPPLQSRPDLNFALLGVGAIGTGIALILGELGATGRLLAVDCQRLERENVGTYSLGGSQDLARAPWKTELARQALPDCDVITYCDRVESLPTAIDEGEVPWPQTVLCALDSPEGRRQVQRIWPDRLIDGATGDTLLGARDYLHGRDPCMMCVFPAREERSGVERFAEELGLSPDLLARGDEVLREEHIESLTDAQRLRLLPHLNRPICGLARAASLTGLKAEGFMPAVPFISLQAACLAVGRLLIAGSCSHPLPNLVQYDGLGDPRRATLERMKPKVDCYCQTKADRISLVRTRRARGEHI